MELKSNGEQGLEEEQDPEEGKPVNKTKAVDKMVADYMAGRSQNQIDKGVEAAEETPSVRDPSQPPEGYVSGAPPEDNRTIRDKQRDTLQRKYKGR